MVGLLLLVGCTRELPAGDPARPDIVLVSIDSLRPDHLSSYGNDRPTSPALDRLAGRGLRFTDARAASPWTLPSHLTMLTGLWPTEHGVVEDTLKLPAEVPLVQERLREAGYATAGFVSTIYVSGQYGFSRGFDAWDDFGIGERDNLKHPVRIDTLVDSALKFVRAQQPGTPVFLFLHVYDVHYPYLPPEPYNSMYDEAGTPQSTAYKQYKVYQRAPLSEERMAHQVAQYDESIRYVDDALGGLVEVWDKARPAFWIVTADHGEEFGERGSWGHGHTLKPEALRIPMIVAGPGIAPAVRSDRVGTIDVAATVAGLAGLKWDGVGLDVRQPAPPRRFWQETSRFATNRIGVLDGSVRLEIDLTTGRREWFELQLDPGEKHPMAPPDDSLERALVTTLGEPWRLDAPSATTEGVFLRGGAIVGERLEGPGSFGLWPPDAKLSAGASQGQGVLTGSVDGAWTYTGARRSQGATISAETRAQLEALGYVQGGEGAAPDGPAPDGAAAPVAPR